jgi:hypothetical protein
MEAFMIGRRRGLRGGLVVLVIAAGLVAVGPALPAAAEGQRGSAFVWNYDATPELGTWYTPAGPYQYNSTSPDEPNNRIIRLATGWYVVEIPGLVGFGATHATAYGWDAAYCIAGDTEAQTYSLVDVQCTDAKGKPIDHEFTLSFTNVNEPWPGQHMAYMEVEDDGTIWTSRHFNSGGGLSTVTRNGSAYLVRIPGLGSCGGHVQVTSAHPVARCKVASWGPSGGDEVVEVRCWHTGWFGAPENAPFILTYVSQQNILGLPAGVPPDGHESAYAWADQPRAPEYTPNAFYQYTSSGSEATAETLGNGRSRITFTGVNMNNGNAQVTAYGYGQEYCGINSWWGNSVQVGCYDWDGTPIDTYYTVAFTGL